jgi:hypothetical protein
LSGDFAQPLGGFKHAINFAPVGLTTKLASYTWDDALSHNLTDAPCGTPAKRELDVINLRVNKTPIQIDA